MTTAKPQHRAQPTATRSRRTTRALVSWLGQRYRLGWRTHPILYLADTVCGALFLGSFAAAHTGVLPWWTVTVVFLVGALVSTAAFVARPWPPFPARPASNRDTEVVDPCPPSDSTTGRTGEEAPG